MPRRFEKALDDLHKPGQTPSERLEKLAAQVILMSEELKNTAALLREEEQRHDDPQAP